MSDDMVTCPRCLPDNRRDPESASEGFIWWDDATEKEQKEAREPDGDNETQCPLCEGATEVTPLQAQAWQNGWTTVDTGIRGLDWADVPVPDDIPKAKFSFAWVDDDNAYVIATHPVDAVPSTDYRIGVLSWDSDSWCFTRMDRNGVQISGASTIECDAALEAQLRKDNEDALMKSTTHATQTALLAGVETKAKLYRDDSREMAVLGAILVARRWWRIFWSADA